MCWRKRRDPSFTRGSPAPKRPSKPRRSCSFFSSRRCRFQSTPKGGLVRKVVERVAAEFVVGKAVAEPNVVALSRFGLPASSTCQTRRLRMRVCCSLDRRGTNGLRGGVPTGSSALPRACRPVPQAGSSSFRTVPGVASSASSSMNRMLTISRTASRGVKVVARRLIGQFVEASDQVLEDEPHLRVGHGVRVEIDAGELGDDEVRGCSPHASARSHSRTRRTRRCPLRSLRILECS